MIYKVCIPAELSANIRKAYIVTTRTKMRYCSLEWPKVFKAFKTPNGDDVFLNPEQIESIKETSLLSMQWKSGGDVKHYALTSKADSFAIEVNLGEGKSASIIPSDRDCLGIYTQYAAAQTFEEFE